MNEYSRWSRDRAAERALEHADWSGASEDDGDAIWNFAFGSNLNAERVRCRNIVPVRAPLRCRLPDWCLLFNHIGGYANIESSARIRTDAFDLAALPRPVPSDVHGVLILLSRSHFAELARQEYGYDTVAVEVEVYGDDVHVDGGAAEAAVAPRRRRALAFKSAACAVTDARTLPSARYLRLIQDGAHESALDSAYVQWLDTIQPAS